MPTSSLPSVYLQDETHDDTNSKTLLRQRQNKKTVMRHAPASPDSGVSDMDSSSSFYATPRYH